MKKLFSVLLVCVLLISLASCTGRNRSGQGSPDTATAGSVGALGRAESTAAEETTLAAEETVPAETTSSQENQTTTTQTAANVMGTEAYSCELFTCTIPQGWQVKYNAYDAGDDVTRLVVFVIDPKDSHNIIFYVQALEPFFADIASKTAMLAYLDSYYEWSPVLNRLSAEGVIGEWAGIYTILEAQGALDMVAFKNYTVKNILQSFSADGNTDKTVCSGVLAEVTIPGAAASYAMYFENSLVQTAFSDIGYYTGYNNMGFVVDPELYQNGLETVAACKSSFDFTGFLNQHTVEYQISQSRFSIPYIPFQ